ncbi:hypothetical protein [Streptococcus acidominimus]|uniref:hypothetical protein n=1 Tax=Streptococcus acidominimus TaxID=1326 RepID=UPI0014303318|nr:hypothetical protein [Streptococcus acidominimus]MBF0819504.1 hypothetical protein [Streptococcus acidominimus]MBF0838094.1 hypothetical protein [Streptococcus acidominimus]MBF0846449.1 hypothetical protein [Streptococcus danieliae]
MKKTILTKYCNSEEQKGSSGSIFEEKFERYIETKVKKIMKNPKKYPFIKIIDNGE